MQERKVILAIDDMSMNLRTIKVLLEKHFDIRLAKSGQLGLTILGCEKISLILLDIEMPGMSGFEFLDKMKNNAHVYDVPVIFISSHATPDLIKYASKYDGVKDYIIKPITREILEKKVFAALNIDPLTAYEYDDI
ncbi:MAG: response regulator [Treponema sp.]|jgi:putative two-component system response regulator|nr:response regulator [Treponema sp.]